MTCRVETCRCNSIIKCCVWLKFVYSSIIKNTMGWLQLKWSSNASDLYFGSAWFLSHGQDTDYPDRFCGFFLVCPHIHWFSFFNYYYHFLPHPLHFTVPLVPTVCTLFFILFQSTVLICTLLLFLSTVLYVSWSCFINTYLFNLLAVEFFFQND